MNVRRKLEQVERAIAYFAREADEAHRYGDEHCRNIWLSAVAVYEDRADALQRIIVGGK